MLKNKENLRKILIEILILVICGIALFYQTKKVGFHEDEGYTLCSSVNPDNGLMTAYDNDSPVWRTKEYVKNFMTLTPNNFLNFKALYMNQAYDNHPPIFYTLVHFSSILFGGQFNVYTVFVVNIIAFIFSCLILKKILTLLGKENLIIPSLILYGLCMGTISMVLFQRMYMLLTTFIMLYFYLSLKIYKNDFEFDKKLKIQLGIATVLGFLTQYFFAIYAFFIFAIMIVEMIRNNKQDKIPMYLGYHVLYALIGILLFVPCLKHLLFSDRGLTNLGNTGYFDHLLMYLKHLAYAFNINQNLPLLIGIIFTLFAIGTVYYFVKSKDKFIPCMLVIPSIFYFLIAVKMTSFQELRYIMAVIPFVVLTFFFILDDLITVKYKDIIFAIMAIVIVSIGFISSKPKFLYENYKEILDIANSNSEKSFVYVYDNFFNHMQSVPEMMVYEKTLIINYNNGELDVVVNDESLKNEDSFILSIKSYMDNDTILNELKDKSDFKNIANIYQIENNSEVVGNNYYLVSKWPKRDVYQWDIFLNWSDRIIE